MTWLIYLADLVELSILASTLNLTAPITSVIRIDYILCKGLALSMANLILSPLAVFTKSSFSGWTWIYQLRRFLNRWIIMTCFRSTDNCFDLLVWYSWVWHADEHLDLILLLCYAWDYYLDIDRTQCQVAWLYSLGLLLLYGGTT